MTGITVETMSDKFAPCDTAELLRQIGPMNILAISGGRIIRRETGVALPVGRGYRVTVDLAGDDTYTVRRVFVRGAKSWIKGEESGVYCDQVAEIAYRASCFVNVDFGAHHVELPSEYTIAAASRGDSARPVVLAQVRRGSL